MTIVARFTARHRLAIIVAACLVLVAAPFGIRRVKVQDSWIDGFARGSAFRRATERTNALFHGTHLLLLHLAFDPPEEAVPQARGRRGPLLDPARLSAIGELERFVRRQPGVGGVLGAASHLEAVSYLWLGRREDARRIPERPERVALVLDRFDMGRGAHRRREVIDDDLSRTVVTVFLKNANYRGTARLMAAVRDYERRHLAPLGARLDFAGDVAVSQAMIPAIVGSQVASILLAPLACLAVIALLYRSLSTGALAVLPAGVAAAWVFGLMGWTGIPLGVATSMFCAITLGIGVDYAIHLLERWRELRREGGPAATGRAVAAVGPALLTDSLAIAGGFGLLALSQVPANARLGLLVAAALLSACLLTLVGIASLLAARERRAPAGF